VITLALAFYWARQLRTWAELGLVFHFNGGTLGVLVGLAVVAIVIVRQRVHALHDDEALDHVRHQLARLELMLPHSREELGWFYRLSITAGVCEEVLYRGYLIWYLAHAMGLIPAMLVGAVMFGVAHAYQGPRGMLVTAAVGAFLGGVFLVSGSLYLGMVVHALMDVHSGHLGFVALTQPAHEPPDEWSADAPTPEGEPAFAAEEAPGAAESEAAAHETRYTPGTEA
jgi:membrane protease YdiL (CAAX protease family)